MSQYSADCVHLVSAFQSTFPHVTYLWDFVGDCVREGRLLPLEKYCIMPGDTHCKSSPTRESPEVRKRARITLSDRVSMQASDLLITCFADGRPRCVRNIFALRIRASQNGVLDSFQKLVKRCKRYNSVSDAEVLRSLLRNKGDVEDTLRDFEL